MTESHTPNADSDARCGKRLSTRPYWMSPDQYDPCDCLLPVNHTGECACRCDENAGVVIDPTTVTAPGDPEPPFCTVCRKEILYGSRCHEHPFGVVSE